MVEHMLSLDGGQTATANYTSSELEAADPYYDTTSYGAIILVATSFFALVISIPGLAWHIKNRNLSASSLVGWIVLLNVTNIINALVWPNDNIASWWDGQVYCDAEIKLEIAASMGLIGSLVCIMHSLAQALDTHNIRLMSSKAQRIFQLILHITLCVGLPLLVALLHFVLQPLRYYIFAIAGCKASYSGVWYTMLLGWVWPPVLCVVSGFYACVLAVRVYRYRRDFVSILSNSSSGMNKSRFLRLFISALIVLIVVIPVQALGLYYNIVNVLGNTWAPESWQTIVYVPTFGMVFPDRWVRVGIAIPVFLCWGWGKDTNSIYKSWLRLLGITKIFPSLAHSDSTSSPANNKRGHSHSTTSRSSTMFSKAKTLFSSKDQDITHSGSIHSSLGSPFRFNPKLGKMEDIESQNCNHGNQLKKVMAESITTTSVNGGIERSDITPVDAEAQAKSWESSQQAMEAARRTNDFEAMVMNNLT